MQGAYTLTCKEGLLLPFQLIEPILLKLLLDTLQVGLILGAVSPKRTQLSCLVHGSGRSWVSTTIEKEDNTAFPAPHPLGQRTTNG